MVCDAKLKACIYNWRAVAQSQSTNVGKCCPFRPLVTRWFVMMMGCDVKVKSMYVDGRSRVSQTDPLVNRRMRRLPCRIFGDWWLGDWWWCQGQVHVAEAELSLQSISTSAKVALWLSHVFQWKSRSMGADYAKPWRSLQQALNGSFCTKLHKWLLTTD